MIAMVILSAATAAVILPFSTGAALNAEGVRQTVGTRLAADLLEQMLNTGYDKIYEYNYEAPGTLMDANWEPYADPIYQKFSRWPTVSDVYINGQLCNDVKCVTVRVYYNWAGIDKPMVQLSTLVGR